MHGRAAADRRRGGHVLRCVLGQADALSAVGAGAGDAVDLREVGVAGDGSEGGGRGGGEFGTVCGTQAPVYRSDSSPAAQSDASGVGPVVGPANAATAGAAATASANPPAMISRRAEISKIAIVTLSVVIDRVVEWILWKLRAICTASSSSLTTRRVKLPQAWEWSRADEALSLGAGAHCGTRHGDGACRLLFLRQPDALAGIGPGAGDAVDRRQTTGRRRAEGRRVGHQIGGAHAGEGVRGLAVGARRGRGGCAGGDRHGGQRGCRGDRDCESSCEDQTSY